MLMSAFFKDIFQQNFKVQKIVFMKCYCYSIDYMFAQCQLFQSTVSAFLHYNVAVYILVQSKEEYSLIWKAKPLTIQTDKGKW